MLAKLGYTTNHDLKEHTLLWQRETHYSPKQVAVDFQKPVPRQGITTERLASDPEDTA